MDDSRCAALETMFLALSDKTRLRLLTLMAGGEVSVGYLAEQLSESQPKISRHLAYLRGAGLVSTRRDGKWIYYGIEAQRDNAFEQVLDAAIAAMENGAVRARTVSVDVADTSGGRLRTDEQNISAEANVSEWRPAELEIYLL
jgi:DNA-binding transcriptional ArsR family regulator